MAAQVTSIDHLPNDTVRCILSKLPVKTLLTLRYVSKSWRATISATISDLAFVKTQHQHHFTNSYSLFLRKATFSDHRRTTYDFSLVRARDDDDDDDDDTSFQLESSLVCPRPGFNDVLCTCEGVVLLTTCSRNSYRAFMLWNPSTRKEVRFLFPYKFEHCPAKHGMCYDPVTGDFKVVVACNTHYTVYSCKNNLWSEPRVFPYSCEMGNSEGLFVDGVIYWVVLDKEEARRSKEIVYFDPSDDSFQKLEKPKSMIDGSEFDLVVLRGCLCLYTFDIGEIQIWIKEEGKDRIAWTELMSIESEQDVWFRPVCSLENDKILLDLEIDGFVVYNPRGKTFGEEFDYSFDHSSLHVQMVPCKETLLFPFEDMRRPKRKRSKPLKYERFSIFRRK